MTHKWPARVALALWLVLLLWLLREVAAHGAPAPLPRRERPRPPHHLAGSHVLVYGGCEWSVTLSGGGGYRATRPHCRTWVGTWREGAPGVVEAREWPEGGNGSVPLTWTARPGAAGKLVQVTEER